MPLLLPIFFLWIARVVTDGKVRSVRALSAPMPTPTLHIYKIQDVGDMPAGRVKQGVVRPDNEALFFPRTDHRARHWKGVHGLRCTINVWTGLSQVTAWV